MKVLELPAALRPGNLLFAPRLAPRLARIGDALDFGLSELTQVPFARLRGAMALSTEMRGNEIRVLLLFVRNSRPLMIQDVKLRLKSFELEPAKPPESLRILLQGLGELAPHLLIDNGTEAFLDGGPLPEVGVRIVDAATTFGTLLPQGTSSTEGQEPGEDEKTEEKDDAQKALAEAERTVAELVEAGVGNADEPEEGDSTPAFREDTAEASPEDPPESSEPSSPAQNVWWSDPGQQTLVALTPGAVLILNGSPQILKAREEALGAGKNPRIVLGSEARAIFLNELEQVRLLPERRYVSLSGKGGTERVTCSDEVLARRLFQHLETALPTWHHERRSLSRKTALTPFLALPAGLTIVWLVLLGLTLRGGNGPEWLAGFSIDVIVVGGLVTVGLSLLPALRRLREPPPEAEELVPSTPSG